jgi:lipopolysaccharide transport protein LptA
MKNAVILSLSAIMCAPCLAAPLGAGAFDMISISADEASEDEQPGILHFNGHFLMRSDEWNLTSDAATVYGSPDRPDRVVLKGSPAHFVVNRTDGAQPGQIEADAPVVEYLREGNELLLSSGATLKLGDEIIHSKHIEYNIGTNRYTAGGADGVRIEVPPVE